MELLRYIHLMVTLTTDKVKFYNYNTLKHTKYYLTILQEMALLLQRSIWIDFYFNGQVMLLFKSQSNCPLPETVHIKWAQSAGRSHFEHVIIVVVWHSQSERKTCSCCLHEGNYANSTQGLTIPMSIVILYAQMYGA